MLFAKIVLTEDIERVIPLRGQNNRWSAGTEFYVRQDQPGYGMVVCFHPDAGIVIPPDAARVLKTFGSHSEMWNAYRKDEKTYDHKENAQ